MNVLVIGGGGREHAIVWKLSQSPRITKLYCAPGNAGIAGLAETVAIAATDIDKLLDFAVQNSIDLTVVGMESTLVLGIVDAFERRGLRIFGPTQAAAVIEGSKVFSKQLMKKYGIPTAAYESFNNLPDAEQYIKTCPYPLVVKADGLALGKGVLICQNHDEARQALEQIMVEKKFGDSGNSVIIEEFLTGREVSVLAFCDGETVVPMTSARDYKRALDGDKGLNTGGMGCVSPCEYYTEDIAAYCMAHIFKPTVTAMKKENRPYKGVLYFGLMVTANGVKVIEYNARFGDPETQVVLPRMKTDLLPVLEACIDGNLSQMRIEWADDAAVCVVIASGGYPGHYETGLAITGLDAVSDATVFHAGTGLKNGQIVTNGGRVLGVTGLGENTRRAASNAYKALEPIQFNNCFCRKDIGI